MKHKKVRTPSALAMKVAQRLEGLKPGVYERLPASDFARESVDAAAVIIDAELAPLVEALRIVAERDTMTPWCVASKALARTEGGS